jgi:hypothetical protein
MASARAAPVFRSMARAMFQLRVAQSTLSPAREPTSSMAQHSSSFAMDTSMRATTSTPRPMCSSATSLVLRWAAPSSATICSSSPPIRPVRSPIPPQRVCHAHRGRTRQHILQCHNQYNSADSLVLCQHRRSESLQVHSSAIQRRLRERGEDFMDPFSLIVHYHLSENCSRLVIDVEIENTFAVNKMQLVFESVQASAH